MARRAPVCRKNVKENALSHLLIAGAGAAGMLAAGAACRAGHTVTLIEHSGLPGKKILVTGKGRCNLTNACDLDSFLAHVRTNPRFLYSALRGFGPDDTMALFEELGVPLKVERGRRVFPASDRAEDIRAALVRYAAGAQWVEGRVQRLLTADGRVAGVQLADGRKLYAPAVLLATGGCSYPSTGSTGDGWQLAAAVGHTLLPPVPSLVALLVRGGECRRMMGLSLRNVALRLEEDGRTVFAEQGELLFTHFGISGPLTLSASTCLARDLAAHHYTAVIDWKPALEAATLDARLQRELAAAAGASAQRVLEKLLPRSAAPVFADRWGLAAGTPAAAVTRAQRQALVTLLKNFTLPVSGRGDMQHAVVTAGGVDVREVDPKTMQSRLLPGLYFAGELLDVDGVTGGYNLQIAFSTAMAAARHLV